jgi:hypothetical protein
MEQRHGYLLEASALEASALEASAGSEPDHTSALPATEPTAPEPSS